MSALCTRRASHVANRSYPSQPGDTQAHAWAKSSWVRDADDDSPKAQRLQKEARQDHHPQRCSLLLGAN
eukprot:2826089-Heterocapsa_arctica.AAC.1